MWQIRTVIEQAIGFGYDGIEWRGGPDGHVQPDIPESKKTLIRQGCSDSGLISLAVTAYTGFVSNSAAERASNLEELRRYVDLAAELGAHYVRTFLGELPEGVHINSSLYKNILVCLNAASEHASSVGVKIAVEPHDSFALSSIVFPIFDLERSHPDLRVIWDVGNAFAAGEEPDTGFALLKDRLAYVQVKDGMRDGSNWRLCSLGQGNVPLAQAFGLLLENGFEGAFSVEWEYAWHPELEAPEFALPRSLQMVQELLSAAQPEST